MIVCTLCCLLPVGGARPAAGLVELGADSRPRAPDDPRGVLADFGVTLPADTAIRVCDFTAETRFMVLPMRPAGTEGWSEEKLAMLADVRQHGRHRPAEKSEGRVMDGIHDMGGMQGFGKVDWKPNEPYLTAAGRDTASPSTAP